MAVKPTFLRSLLQPQISGDKSLEHLQKMLTEHCKSKPNIISSFLVECRGQVESVPVYVTDLKRLTKIFFICKCPRGYTANINISSRTFPNEILILLILQLDVAIKQFLVVDTAELG